MTEQEMTVILFEYSANDMAKLKSFTDPFIRQFGGLSKLDYDDFYSQANETLWTSARDYDPTKGTTFEQWFGDNLKRKVRTMMTSRNRQKRVPSSCIVSLDQKIGGEDGNGATLGEVVAAPKHKEQCADFTRYYGGLSFVQQRIADLLMNGYKPEQICEELKLSTGQYKKLYADMSSLDRRLKLKSTRRTHTSVYTQEKENELSNSIQSTTHTGWSVAKIVNDIENMNLLLNHPTQRDDGQWALVAKSNLISDILQNYPIPEIICAEQVIGTGAIVWNIDGKQRCTIMQSYLNNEFKISKNVRRYAIPFNTKRCDEDGNVILVDGKPIFEREVCDIRGRKFKDLPTELRDQFKSYQVQVTLYLNCSDDEISYHIERYNDGRAMNARQRGVTRLGTSIAAQAKRVASNNFFEDCTAFSASDFKGDNVTRAVIESIMATNYLDNWTKNYENGMCRFIRENASAEDFDTVVDIIEALYDVMLDDNGCQAYPEVSKMFNAKDTFLWIALYEKTFQWLCDDPERFVGFLSELNGRMADVTYDDVADGRSYRELAEYRGTKDKPTIEAKLALLARLMEDYLSGKFNGENDTASADSGTTDVNIFEPTPNIVATESDIDEYMNEYDSDAGDTMADSVSSCIDNVADIIANALDPANASDPGLLMTAG